MSRFHRRADAIATLGVRGPEGQPTVATSQVIVGPAPRRLVGAKPVVLPPLHGEAPGAIRRLLALVDALFLMDDSGSMYGQWGDATGIRYAAAQSLTNLMRRSGGGRVGVVHWGSDAPEAQLLPLTDIRRHSKAISRALQVPPTLGGNNLPRALDRAHQLLAIERPSAVPVVFVLTDGCEDLSADLTTPLQRLPESCVHVLLVDRSNGCGPALEDEWNRLPLGSFRRLDHLRTDHLAFQLARVLADAIGLEITEPSTHTAKKEHT